MHMEPSDKGWLRAHYPRATGAQLERFIEKVGLKLDHIKDPTPKQTNKARQQAFNEMMGLVE